MKKQLTLLIVAASLLLVTCKKKSGSDEPESTPVKLLSRIIEVTAPPHPYAGTTFTLFTYDEKKRISLVNRGGNYTSKYAYVGDELHTIETKFNKERTFSEISYVDGKPMKIIQKSYKDGILILEKKLGYIYTGDRVAEIHENEGGVVSVKRLYQYLGDNIIQEDYQSDFQVSSENSYGTKKNIYYNSKLKYVNPADDLDRFSVNELKKVILKYSNGTSVLITYTYTYDDDGFPITLLREVKNQFGDDTGTFSYTFEYKIY